MWRLTRCPLQMCSNFARMLVLVLKNGLDVSMDFVNLPTLAVCHVVRQAPLVFREPPVALVPVVERPCLRYGSMCGGDDDFLKACVCGLIEVAV